MVSSPYFDNFFDSFHGTWLWCCWSVSSLSRTFFGMNLSAVSTNILGPVLFCDEMKAIPPGRNTLVISCIAFLSVFKYSMTPVHMIKSNVFGSKLIDSMSSCVYCMTFFSFGCPLTVFFVALSMSFEMSAATTVYPLSSNSFTIAPDPHPMSSAFPGFSPSSISSVYLCRR